MFLRALQRACRHLSTENDVRGETAWRAQIHVNQSRVDEFAAKIQSDPADYQRDLKDIVVFWEKALEYLVLEDEGFPPRRITQNDGNGYMPYPRLRLLYFGYSTYFQEVDSIAEFIPHQISSAVRVGAYSTTDLPEEDLRRRVNLLDRFLDIAFDAERAGHQRESLAAQIDRMW